MRKAIAIGTIGLCICAGFLLRTETVAKTSEPEQQKYIVRYGITYDWGSTIITDDGNEWTLIDAPEYENGTEVRVLFDSNNTRNVTDDMIIDVTERNN